MEGLVLKIDLTDFLLNPINTSVFDTITTTELATCVAKGVPIQGQIEGNMIKHKAPSFHGLLQTFELAFNKHVHMKLTPDDLLLPLIQAASVIKKEQTTTTNEKIKLEVDKTLLSWPDTFSKFRELIQKNIPDSELFRGSFSTTGELQNIAYDVALMDAHQNLFKYDTFSFCGIPSITLLGSLSDWKLLVEKVESILNILPDIGIWKQELMSTVLSIYKSAEDPTSKKSKEFWLNVYKFNQESGGDTVTGWINLFFPIYGKIMQSSKTYEGITTHRKMDSFMGSIASAPTTHTDEFGGKHKYRYYAGQFGVTQDTSDLSIIPCWAWIVMEE